MDLQLQVPKFPRQDVSHYDKLPFQAKNNRKVLHIKCDKDDANRVQYAEEALIFQDSGVLMLISLPQVKSGASCKLLKSIPTISAL